MYRLPAVCDMLGLSDRQSRGGSCFHGSYIWVCGGMGNKAAGLCKGGFQALRGEGRRKGAGVGAQVLLAFFFQGLGSGVCSKLWGLTDRHEDGCVPSPEIRGRLQLAKLGLNP